MNRYPNIVLISIDCMRADLAPWNDDPSGLARAGVSKPTLPTLERLAEQSVCFHDAITTAPYTTSAHASALTGLFSPQHGIQSMMNTALDPSVVSLPEWLKDRGYATTLFTDQKRMFSATSIHRGFDRVADHTSDAFKAMANGNGAPVFAMFHFFDVHAPYCWTPDTARPDANDDFFEGIQTAAEEVGRDPSALLEKAKQGGRVVRDIWDLFAGCEGEAELHRRMYVKGVEKFDRGRLAAIVEQVDRACPPDNTILIIMSDHGESFLTGLVPQHAGGMWEDVIGVVLMMRVPGVGPSVVPDTVSLADIVPTLAHLLGEAPEMNRTVAPLTGKSLVDLMQGGADPERLVFCQGMRSYRPALEEARSEARRQGLRLEPGHGLRLRSLIPQLYYESCVRSATTKYVVRGNPLADARMCREMTSSEFRRFLTSDYIGHPNGEPETMGIWAHLPLPRALLLRLSELRLSVTEYPKHFMVRLGHGKGDSDRLVVRRGTRRWREYKPYLETIANMAHRSVPGAPLCDPSPEADTIRDHLAALGYM